MRAGVWVYNSLEVEMGERKAEPDGWSCWGEGKVWELDVEQVKA